LKFEPKGVIVPIVTSFEQNEEFNERVHREMIEFLIEKGVHGIFAAGSQGEFWALSREEKKRVFEVTTDEVNGRVPVYAGTGAESTRETIELTKIAKDAGVDAVSVITPYFVKPSSKELLEHYRLVASGADLPVIVYNNPERTGGVTVDVETLIELKDECDNVEGIKDSSGDLTLTTEYIRNCGSRVAVLAGRDSLILQTIVSGGRGAVAACANVIPEIIVSLYDAAVKGNYKDALELQRKVAPLRIAFKLGSFPQVVKEAVNIIGFDVGNCRMPVTPLTSKKREKLIEILRELKAII